ncbi:MAG: hypothetical protein HND48_12780 [Chloroflexi bacterium]|nr:hypothetical protein [Chloroflexota bacterium]
MSNNWVQVNYNGILGWSRSAFFRYLERPITDAPIDGVVADSRRSSARRATSTSTC